MPSFATAIPEPTDGGRTYTFRLRDGIRWSTGKPVTVEDVKRGIERAVAATALPPLTKLLVGAGRCGPSRCDISGITVDNAIRTVTIRLVHASGNLLDLLTQFCPAAPPGLPLAAQSSPIPATGPYQVASYVPDKLIVFTRNPFFHEWSAAAQPAGFPDRIEYRMLPAASAKNAVNDVFAATADWADAIDAHAARDAQALDSLRTRFGIRLRVTPSQNMFGVFLNTRVAPFNNVNVRRALGYAIDRKAVADNWFAPATITCQFLPPDYPGYRPTCPYTTLSGAHAWQGTNLPMALKLIQGLHPERTTVTVWAPPSARSGIQPVTDALRAMRYHVQYRVPQVPIAEYFGYVFDPRNHVQAGMMGWLTADASAANLLTVYRCASDQNPGEFCDPALDRLMVRAEEVQATSLAAADELWAQVERGLLAAAPWVPLVNTSLVDVLSRRVHNFKRSPTLGVLFDQMWVQ